MGPEREWIWEAAVGFVEIVVVENLPFGPA